MSPADSMGDLVTYLTTKLINIYVFKLEYLVLAGGLINFD